MAPLDDKVPLNDVLPLNVGLKSAREETMISCLGRPEEPLTWTDQRDRVSPTVKSLLRTVTIGKVRATGVGAALDSLQTVLAAAFKETPALADALQSAGMLDVRYRKPTSGAVSHLISNHAWGTAIDFNLVGLPPPGFTGATIPRFIALLVPHFHQAGWYSGIAFRDDMHFEVADETVRDWATRGLFKP